MIRGWSERTGLLATLLALSFSTARAFFLSLADFSQCSFSLNWLAFNYKKTVQLSSRTDKICPIRDIIDFWQGLFIFFPKSLFSDDLTRQYHKLFMRSTLCLSFWNNSLSFFNTTYSYAHADCIAYLLHGSFVSGLFSPPAWLLPVWDFSTISIINLTYLCSTSNMALWFCSLSLSYTTEY